MNEAAVAPTLASYAAERGLHFRETSFALPQATQLLRHGFMREVSGLVRGNLPGGLEDAWLSHVAYVYEGTNDLRRSHFTLVLIQAPESIGFAVRVLCHDRDLSKLDMTNPDSDREVIEAGDRAVSLESQGFLERYALFTDNDQDENSVWRLFAPTLIDWLTASAPKDFSFELQDGALCCFVPGSLTDPEEIDGICEASARVLREVERIGAGGGGKAVDAGDRRSRVDEELARAGVAVAERARGAHDAAGDFTAIGPAIYLDRGDFLVFREDQVVWQYEKPDIAEFFAGVDVLGRHVWVHVGDLAVAIAGADHVVWEDVGKAEESRLDGPGVGGVNLEGSGRGRMAGRGHARR